MSRISRIPPPTSHPTSSAAAHFHSSARRHNQLPKSPFQTFVDVLKDGCARIGVSLRTSSSSRETWSNSRTRKLRKRSRMNAPRCVPVPQYFIPNLTLSACRYSLPPVSRRVLAYAPQLKNSGKLVSRSAIPYRRLLNLWKSPTLWVLCVSERLSSISSPQPYSMRVDLKCHRSRVFNDREDNRTHPKHRRLQDPCRDHC